MQYLLPIYLPMYGIASIGQPGGFQETNQFLRRIGRWKWGIRRQIDVTKIPNRK